MLPVSRAFLSLALAALWALLSAHAAPSVPTAPTAVESPPAEPEYLAKFRAWAAQNAPGAAMVLRKEGRTFFYQCGEANAEQHVPVTPDSIFELASITKVYTTTLLALAIDRGEMSLDDLLVRWVPELKNGGDINRVTLRHLATHTAGLPRSPGALPWHPAPDPLSYTREDLFRYLREWKAPQAPGAKYDYSNISFGLLGMALEALKQKPYGEILQTELLGPLGQNSTRVRLTPELLTRLTEGYGPEKGLRVGRTPIGTWPASGALCSSARDMALFLEANMGERPEAPAPILTAMQHAQQWGGFKVSDRMTQSLGWQILQIDGAKLIDKNGTLVGCSTYIGMAPEQHLGIVLMANRGKRPATLLGRQILAQLAGALLPQLPPSKAPGEAAEAKSAEPSGH